MIWSIATRELRSLFLTPLAWAILAITQFILCLFFLKSVEVYLTIQPKLEANNSDPGITAFIAESLYGSAAFILMMIVPLLTMRLISSERQNKTLTLLFSAPLSMTEIILGKYFGVILFLLIMIAMISIMPLTVLIGGSLDFGLLFSNLMGLFLILSTFAAIGLYISTITNNPILSAVISFTSLLLLNLIDLLATVDNPSGLFAYISLRSHLNNLFTGFFKSSDVIYYLLLIVTFIILSIRRLDNDRLQQ
ncbi:MAG: ABC transporter permease subunit [Thiohalomonadales bacterium]